MPDSARAAVRRRKGVVEGAGNSNSVSVSDSAHRCWLLLTSVTLPNTRINQRPPALASAPNRHGVQEVRGSNPRAPIV